MDILQELQNLNENELTDLQNAITEELMSRSKKKFFSNFEFVGLSKDLEEKLKDKIINTLVDQLPEKKK